MVSISSPGGYQVANYQSVLMNQSLLSKCESEITVWFSEKIFHLWPSCSSVGLFEHLTFFGNFMYSMFMRGCVFVARTCVYVCGCWYFTCLLAMNTNWARSSCLEQSARTSLMTPFLPPFIPPFPARTLSARKWHHQASWQKLSDSLCSESNINSENIHWDSMYCICSNTTNSLKNY